MENGLCHLNMLDILKQLGLEGESFVWQDLALCLGGNTEWWFDLYEKDDEVAAAADEACLRCPVLAQCFLAGSKGQYGVWGGIFWNGAGKPDKNKNNHKSEETMQEIHGRVKDYLQSIDSEDS